MKKIIKKILVVGVATTMTFGGVIAADLTDIKDTFEGSGTAIVVGDDVTADEAAQTTLFEYLSGEMGEEEVSFEALQIDKEDVILGDNIATGAALDTTYTDDDGFTGLPCINN